MKTKIIPLALSLALVTPIAQANQNLTFENVYYKPLYKKQAFTYGAIALATGVAAGLTVYTAGTGAPAAGTFVGSVASWVGGGGAGSYMAGLSTIGSFVGGNAITGAAILNGTSAMFFGAASTKGTASFVLQVMDQFPDQINSFLFDENGDKVSEIYYALPIQLPKNLGSEENRKLVDSFEKINKELKELSEKEAKSEYEQQIQENLKKLNDIKNKAEALAKDSDKKNDAILGAILAYKFEDKELFKKTVLNISDDVTSNEGLLYYLKSIALFNSKKYDEAKKYAKMANEKEKKVIEPLMLLAMILEENGESQNIEQEVVEKLEDFSTDYYSTTNSLTVAYDLVATVYQKEGEFQSALKFYQKEYDSTSSNYLYDQDKKAIILNKMAQMNSYIGNKNLSDDLYSKALKRVKEEKYKTAIEESHKEYTKIIGGEV
jgi:hypothetical protein